MKKYNAYIVGTIVKQEMCGNIRIIRQISWESVVIKEKGKVR